MNLQAARHSIVCIILMSLCELSAAQNCEAIRAQVDAIFNGQHSHSGPYGLMGESDLRAIENLQSQYYRCLQGGNNQQKNSYEQEYREPEWVKQQRAEEARKQREADRKHNRERIEEIKKQLEEENRREITQRSADEKKATVEFQTEIKQIDKKRQAIAVERDDKLQQIIKSNAPQANTVEESIKKQLRTESMMQANPVAKSTFDIHNVYNAGVSTASPSTASAADSAVSNSPSIPSPSGTKEPTRTSFVQDWVQNAPVDKSKLSPTAMQSTQEAAKRAQYQAQQAEIERQTRQNQIEAYWSQVPTLPSRRQGDKQISSSTQNSVRIQTPSSQSEAKQEDKSIWERLTDWGGKLSGEDKAPAMPSPTTNNN